MDSQEQKPTLLEYASAGQPSRAHAHWKYTLVLLFAGALVVAAMLRADSGRARGISRRTACGANLKAIATSCLVYSEANKRRLPASLDVLTSGGSRAFLQPKQLVCPTTGKPYIYVRNLTNDDDPRRVVAYEPLGNHANGGHIAFLDGHVRWHPKVEHLRLVSQVQTRPARMAPGE